MGWFLGGILRYVNENSLDGWGILGSVWNLFM